MLRLCVLVRRVSDPVAGHFVLLRNLSEAVVYLGCVTDAAGRLREWVELWIQNTDGLDASLPAFREAFSNRTVDERWAHQFEAINQLDPASTLHTGWEKNHPRPLFIDLDQGISVHPSDPGGSNPWELCQEDAALESAGLPNYSRSLFRYLWQPQLGASSRFVPVTAGAPSNSRTVFFDDAFVPGAGFVAINPQGGLLRVHAFSPLGLEDFVDLLGGKPWPGVEQGEKHLEFSGPYRGLEDLATAEQSAARWFLGGSGRTGRFVETLHLRLQLFADVVGCVHACVQRQQLPLLNLSADSFRVRLQSVGKQLPFLWTAGVSLAKPGDAYRFPLKGSETQYFVRVRTGGPSIYLPEGLSDALQGTASVRLRQVVVTDPAQTTIEGTLVLQERLNFGPRDLFWIRLPLATGRVDLYGHLFGAESLARGEVRFRTLGQVFPEAVRKTLKAAEGAAFPRSQFEVLPILSSPCDLYSLGVLGVRSMLVNEQNTLAVALDELLSLARQVGAEYAIDLPLGQRIRTVMEQEPRFLEALGPHRLVREAMDPKDAFGYLPEVLWYDVLGLLLQFFPGVGPDSICKDYGDVPAGALEAVFEPPLSVLKKLLVRSRSLIVTDWKANQEIRALIARRLPERS